MWNQLAYFVNCFCVSKEEEALHEPSDERWRDSTAVEGGITVYSKAPAGEGCTWAWNGCAAPGLLSVSTIFYL